MRRNRWWQPSRQLCVGFNRLHQTRLFFYDCYASVTQKPFPLASSSTDAILSTREIGMDHLKHRQSTSSRAFEASGSLRKGDLTFCAERAGIIRVKRKAARSLKLFETCFCLVYACPGLSKRSSGCRWWLTRWRVATVLYGSMISSTSYYGRSS